MTKATGKARHPHDSSRPSPKAIKKALEKGDMKRLAEALSVRQRRFAEEYIIDFNGSAAAIRAGYAPTYSDRQAHILLHHEGVAALIEHLTRERAGRLEAVLDDNYVIQGIMNVIADAERAGDKLRGYELCARILGMLRDRQEITGKDGEAIEINNLKTEEEARKFTEILKGLADRANDKPNLKVVGGRDGPK